MLKGLKIAMIVYAAIGILLGLGLVFIPGKLLSASGLENVPSYVLWFELIIGIATIVPSFFYILAAQDPLKHIMWVQFAIVWSFFDLIANLYFVFRGIITFNMAGFVIIIDIIFMVALLILYPWRNVPVS